METPGESGHGVLINTKKIPQLTDVALQKNKNKTKHFFISANVFFNYGKK